MLGNREIREEWDTRRLWDRYCGFLDLDMGAFMDIQEQLLMEQVSLLSKSPLGQSIFQGKAPADLRQFRSRVPLTCGKSYQGFLVEGQEATLPEAPVAWAHTTDDGGEFKKIPYTQRAYDRLIDHTVACAVLAAASRRGDYSLPKQPRTLFHIPPPPYLTALVAQGLYDRGLFSPVIPLDKGNELDFAEKIRFGFDAALNSGVDVIGSKSSILVRMGEGFAEASGRQKHLPANAWRPSVALRLLRAVVRSKLQHRRILPKDLWPTKAILCWGTDTELYRERIAEYWGHEPYEFFASTEMGIIAMQSWRKKAMTFVPDSAFLEFIPEDQWLESRRNPAFIPQTLLINQVRPGQTYELVITSFHGMPFLRYRVGFLVRVEAAEDREAGISLPQVRLVDRCDSIIDVAGFTRLGERSIIRALEAANVRHNGWFVRKERDGEQSTLHLYIETKGELSAEEVAQAVHQGLMDTDHDYHDLNTMLGPHPIKVTLLPLGAFQHYTELRLQQGASFSELRPPRVNPPDFQIKDLLQASLLQPA